MKKATTTVLAMLFLAFGYAQRGQVHGSEWDDGSSTSIGNLLRVVVVIGALYWGYNTFFDKKKKD
jgi:hypothetical protein